MLRELIWRKITEEKINMWFSKNYLKWVRTSLNAWQKIRKKCVKCVSTPKYQCKRYYLCCKAYSHLWRPKTVTLDLDPILRIHITKKRKKDLEVFEHEIIMLIVMIYWLGAVKWNVNILFIWNIDIIHKHC